MCDKKLKEKLNKSIKEFEKLYDVKTEKIEIDDKNSEYFAKKVKINGYLNKKIDVVDLKFFCVFKINKNNYDDIFCKMIINIDEKDISSIKGNYIEGKWLGLDWSDKL